MFKKLLAVVADTFGVVDVMVGRVLVVWMVDVVVIGMVDVVVVGVVLVGMVDVVVVGMVDIVDWVTAPKKRIKWKFLREDLKPIISTKWY